MSCADATYGSRELGSIKRIRSVMAALGWGPSAGRERRAEEAFFRASRREQGAWARRCDSADTSLLYRPGVNPLLPTFGPLALPIRCHTLDELTADLPRNSVVLAFRPALLSECIAPNDRFRQGRAPRVQTPHCAPVRGPGRTRRGERNASEGRGPSQVREKVCLYAEEHPRAAYRIDPRASWIMCMATQLQAAMRHRRVRGGHRFVARLLHEQPKAALAASRTCPVHLEECRCRC